MRSKNPEVCVIIPVYNDLAGLATTVSSLEIQDFIAENFEVLVVNDGFDASIADFCKAQKIRSINITPNQGAYVARNQAILSSSSAHVAFLDANVKAAPDWLAKGVEALERFDYVAGNVLISKEEVRDISTFHDYLTAFPIGSYLQKLHFGPTANLFVKREVFHELGMFDSELRSGGDVEFGERVFRSGKFRQWFCSDCVVYHPPRNHEEKLQKAIRVDKGQQILRNKYPERFGKLNAKSNLLTFFGRFLPPSPAKVKRIYKPSDDYSFLSFYLYSARLKYLLHKQKTKLKS